MQHLIWNKRGVLVFEGKNQSCLKFILWARAGHLSPSNPAFCFQMPWRSSQAGHRGWHTATEIHVPLHVNVVLTRSLQKRLPLAQLSWSTYELWARKRKGRGDRNNLAYRMKIVSPHFLRQHPRGHNPIISIQLNQVSCYPRVACHIPPLCPQCLCWAGAHLALGPSIVPTYDMLLHILHLETVFSTTHQAGAPSLLSALWRDPTLNSNILMPCLAHEHWTMMRQAGRQAASMPLGKMSSFQVELQVTSAITQWLNGWRCLVTGLGRAWVGSIATLNLKLPHFSNLEH